jgi:predicted ester cyclase
MTVEDDNKALFHRWFGEVWNKGNYEVAQQVIDGTMRVHGAGGQPVEMGPDGVAGLVRTWRSAFPDGAMAIDGLIAEGDLVCALLTWHGTHQGEFYGIPPSGKTIACTSIGIDRIRNGIIVDGWGELDMVGMMQTMGALPAVGPGAVAQGRSAEWGAARGSTTPSGGGSSANKAIIDRFIQALNKGDRAGVEAVVDKASYVEHAPIWGAETFESGAQVLSELRAAMPDLQFTPDPGIVIAEGDMVGIHSVASGTHSGSPLFGVPASGKKLSWTQTDQVRIANGKIVERWVCSDTLALLQQAGVLPSQG